MNDSVGRLANSADCFSMQLSRNEMNSPAVSTIPNGEADPQTLVHTVRQLCALLLNLKVLALGADSPPESNALAPMVKQQAAVRLWRQPCNCGQHLAGQI